MSISEAELEALELLTKAGKINPQATWIQALPEVRQYVLGLAVRLSDKGDSNDLERPATYSSTDA